MRKPRYPSGWDEKRVTRVLQHYEQQSEEEAVAEDEAGVSPESSTVVGIPRKLLPRVRAMIADEGEKHRSSRSRKSTKKTASRGRRLTR